MLKTNLYPLRSTLDDALAISQVEVTAHSPLLTAGDIVIEERTSATDGSFVQDPRYEDLLPSNVILSSGNYAQGSGIPTFQLPPDLPFHNIGRFFSLYVTGPEVVDEDLSRRLWVELKISLDLPAEAPPIGGICYGGYPYLPYYVTTRGDNSANFGLPRELRVSWGAQHGDGFIDDEVAVSLQEPCSHSGAHQLATGPVISDHLLLRLSDFPKRIHPARNLHERWFVAMPFVFVCGHREHTRYRPRTPAGLLAAVQVGGHRDRSYFEKPLTAGSPQQQATYAGACADYLYLEDDRYYPCSAASAFGGAAARRTYTAGGSTFTERFGTGRLEVGDAVHLYFEQAEEHRRCTAGLRFAFRRAPAYLTDSSPGPSVTLEVWELDPPEGVAPCSPKGDFAEDRYATLIYSQEGVTTGDRDHTAKFRRASASRYFALVIRAEEEGSIFVQDVELVQSVHVVVTPRAARRQHVGALHFRLIGQDLAGDYSRLGPDGFSLEVEHLVAGQVSSVLFSASSLLDLLQTGAARLYGNHRRHAVEDEVATTLPGGYSLHDSSSRSGGWNRLETGDGVEPSWPSVGPTDDPNPNPSLAVGQQTAGDHGFNAFGNQESRSHLRHVSGADQFFLDAVLGVMGSPDGLDPDTYALWKGDAPNEIWAPWGRASNNAAFRERLRVQGVWNINLPPYFETLWNTWQSFESSVLAATNIVLGTLPPNSANLEATTNALLNEFSTVAGTLFRDFIATNLSQLFLVNGFSLGLSPGVSGGGGISAVPFSFNGGGSLGGSLSASMGVPTLLLSNSIGTAGTISLQAHRSGYSYAQHLQNGYQQGRSRTDFLQGETRRRVRRNPVGGSIPERVRGAEIVWQDRLVDIVTGRIPLNLTLPATADAMYRTTDEMLRVRLGRSPTQVGKGDDPVHLDVWFDLREEVARDDY